MPTEPLEHLTIFDFSDREFLLICTDVADADGWFAAVDVMAQLGLANKRLASSRLSWLRRFEAVEREHERDEAGNIRARRNGQLIYTQRWRLTPLGEAIAQGKLRKQDEKTLSSMDEGQMLLAIRWFSQQSKEQSGASRMLAREWRHGYGRY